jgi:iron complex transport system permease protein
LISIAIGSIGLLLIRWRINILSMGDQEARAIGVNSEVLKAVIIICTTIISAGVVAFCGIIGWVGLVIPHICRMLVGPDHRVLLPTTIAIGATYVILIDNLARLISPAEIPLGILTALVGAPFFAFLLRKTKGGWG